MWFPFARTITFLASGGRTGGIEFFDRVSSAVHRWPDMLGKPKHAAC